MAITKAFICDCGCGAVRGAENHWSVVSAHLGSRTDIFTVMPWEFADSEGALHAAGSECVHKLLNAWMEKQREGK